MITALRTNRRQALPGVHLHFSAARLARLFLTVAASLWIAHILLHLLAVATGNDRLGGLVYIFGLGAEQNLPTLYSTLALLVVAGLLGVTARNSKTDRGYWWLLSGAFVFLACDETLQLHEKLIEPVKAALGTSGAFHYAWVIPYGIGSIAFGLAFARFLLRLPRRTAWQFVLGGALFVSGAIGMEMVGGAFFEDGGAKQWSYWTAQTLEEVLEMGGVLVFLFGLGDYITSNLGVLTFRLASEVQVRQELAAEHHRETARRQEPWPVVPQPAAGHHAVHVRVMPQNQGPGGQQYEVDPDAEAAS